MHNTLTLHIRNASYSEKPYVNRVSVAAPPWGELDIDATRPDSEPYRRISLCNAPRKPAMENAYTKIKRAIQEVRDEAEW
jgi:hypothetical protein